MKDAQPAMDSASAMPASTDPDDGIDVTLIRWCLSLTPQERLEALQANVNAIVRLKDAARQTS